jgi:hypothetical protein
LCVDYENPVERNDAVKITIRLLIGSLMLSGWMAPARSQQAPPTSPTQPAPTAEQQAEREKRIAARNAERARAAEKRKAEAVRRNAERKADFARHAEERKSRDAARTAARAAAATQRAAEAEKRRTLGDGTFRFLSSRMNSNFRKVVKGAPYSARAITEYVQKFVDGNQIIRRNETVYYRDSEGRLRVEQQLNNIGKWSASGDAARIIMIGDPVSGEYYNLDPRTRTAVKNVALGRSLAQQRLRQEAKTAGAAAKPSTAPATAPAVAQVSDDGRRRTENLGSQRIEGVEAVGKRTTRTIPAGEIGNTLPIEITDESWFSPELQMMVMTKHHDPRSGDTIYRLTNINRSEPDRSLFQVPADYQLIDRSEPKTAPPTPKTEKLKRSKSEVVIE